MTRKITPAQLDEIEAAAKGAHSVQGRGWHSEVSLGRDTRGRIPAWHRDAKHIAMMDPATTLALVAEVRELKNAARLMQSVIEAKYDRFAEIADIPAEESRCMDPELIEEAALDRVRELRAKVERVREVHQLLAPHLPARLNFCSHCLDDEFGRPVPADWPCDTIKALGEEA